MKQFGWSVLPVFVLNSFLFCSFLFMGQFALAGDSSALVGDLQTKEPVQRYAPVDRGQCVASQIPSYDPSVPRVVKNSLVVGSSAEKKAKEILADKATQISSRRGNFYELIMVYSRSLGVDEHKDESYPNSGCLQRATLSEQCELDHATQALKCGEICSYKFECVDPRI